MQITVEKYKELVNIPNAVKTTPYGKVINPKAFEKTLLPYEGIYHLINIIYAENFDNIITTNSTPKNENNSTMLPIEKLTAITEKDFYAQYSKQYEKMYSIWKNIGMNTVSGNFVQPLTYGYAAGYTSFINSFDNQGMIIALLLLTLGICCAPIFAAEHQQNAHAVIITTKHGRCKGTWLKFLSGLLLLFYYQLCILVSFICHV